MEWGEVWKFIISFKPYLNRQIWYRINILAYEALNIQRDYIYSLADSENASSHIADMKRELGDVIAQTHMLCQRMDWDYKEVEEEGKKRILEVAAGKG